MTASSPRPAAPDTTGELREAIADALWRDDSGSEVPLSARMLGTQRTYARLADVVLALPAFRALIAERDTAVAQVQAVEALKREGRYDKPTGPWLHVAQIRRALDGAATTGGGE